MRVGNYVMFKRGLKPSGIEKGDKATIIHIDPDDGEVTLEFEDGNTKNVGGPVINRVVTILGTPARDGRFLATDEQVRVTKTGKRLKPRQRRKRKHRRKG